VVERPDEAPRRRAGAEEGQAQQRRPRGIEALSAILGEERREACLLLVGPERAQVFVVEGEVDRAVDLLDRRAPPSGTPCAARDARR
jgi:hypothetical protein